MNGHQPLPVLELEIDDRADDLDAGIADHHIQTAISRHGLRHAGIDLRLIGDIHRDRHGGAAGCGDLFGGDLAGIQRQVGDAHFGALAGKLDGDGLADTARGTGDHGDFVFQLHGIAPGEGLIRG